MRDFKASVIIPTRNRPESLAETISRLGCQDLPPDDYEIVVVDDGSVPPVVLAKARSGPKVTALRCGNGERSAARNIGATAARGKVLVFVDDDITVEADFLSRHLSGHRRWPGALVVGSVVLPGEAMVKPFVRFRQTLEHQGLPESEGPTAVPNFCTAANMSITREAFQGIGGFDSQIVSGEDQDFALRHRLRGGLIVFLPEAVAIHRDTALDVRAYCRRVEWGSRRLIPFCRRYPDWPDNVRRELVNGALRWNGPVSMSLRKLTKSALSARPCREALFFIAAALERIAPASKALDKTYRGLIGIHIFHGYRQGISCHRNDSPAVRAAGTAPAD